MTTMNRSPRHLAKPNIWEAGDVYLVVAIAVLGAMLGALIAW